jgi:hypothetical protein
MEEVLSPSKKCSLSGIAATGNEIDHAQVGKGSAEKDCDRGDS